MLWVGIGRCWWVWSRYGYKFEGKCWALAVSQLELELARQIRIVDTKINIIFGVAAGSGLGAGRRGADPPVSRPQWWRPASAWSRTGELSRGTRKLGRHILPTTRSDHNSCESPPSQLSLPLLDAIQQKISFLRSSDLLSLDPRKQVSYVRLKIRDAVWSKALMSVGRRR